MKTRILSILLLASVFSASAFKVVGYLPSYRFYAVNSIDFNKLTHVMISFANPDENGEFSYSENLSTVVSKAHAANCEVFISIGGGGLNSTVEGYYHTETTAGNRPAFINSLLNLIRSNNLDGVDVDLEAGLMSMSTYNEFVQELSDSCSAEGLGISAAYAKYTGGNVSSATIAKLDFVNMMSYDATGTWAPQSPGPHSPMSLATSDYNYWTGKGFAAKDVIVGVPFYGYEFKNDNTAGAKTWCQIVTDHPGSVNDDQVTTSNSTIYYNGKATIKAKTTYAIQNAGGIMIWELGQDCSGDNSLLDVIIQEMADNNMYVSTQDINLETVNIYPNPATNMLNIKGGFEGEVLIFDVAGNQIKQVSGLVSSIDIAGLAGGLYIIQLKNNQGTITKTIVKK